MDALRSLAEAISSLTTSFVVPSFAFFALFYPSSNALLLIMSSFSFFCFIPYIFGKHAVKMGWMKSLDEIGKIARSKGFMVLTPVFVIGLIILIALNAPPEGIAFALAILANNFIAITILGKEKISLHMMASAGTMALFNLVFGVSFLITLIVLSAVAFARLYLKRHSVKEVLEGGFIGYVVTWIIMFLVLERGNV
ncbi:hypothetical protein HY991_00400 [Candidatus Micrarchaeota archaeon]|nr:hypothetical protein [Candidatus Micrarchaeota archaeon]